MRTRTLLCLLGVATGATALSLHLTRQPLRPAPASPSAPTAALQAASAGTARLRPAIRVSRPGRIETPAHSAEDLALLQQVLPSLAEPVADWSQFTPEQLTVELFPGRPLDFTMKSVQRAGGRTTWIGTNPEQGATLVACGTATLWDAIITVPGADEYSLHITPDTVQVIETAHGVAACGAPVVVAQRLLAATTTGNLLAGEVSAATDSTAINTSDLLVLYSAGAKNSWGSTEEMVNRITAVVAAANTYLEQSQVANLRWNLVGTAEAPTYPTTSKLEDDLTQLSNSSSPVGTLAAQKRTEYGADQVMLIVDGSRDYAGIAYTPGYLSVVHHPGSAATAAHELAHNFGCRHDRQEAKAVDSDGRYYYGHRFNHNGQDTGTIMSYADYLVPYFSNPSVTYQGIAVGVAAGEPKAADNARWLREHAADIAALVPTKTVSTPIITSQPVSETVVLGRAISLSVTATGNQLNYQWAKDGVDISGATLSSFYKTPSVAGDAGSYTVLVSNTAGSIRSSAATVTIQAAPTTTPGTTTGTSGGGGGGAFGPASLLALGALLVRGATRHNRAAA